MKALYYIKSLLFVLIISQTNFNLCAQNSKEDKYYINNNRHWKADIPIWVPGFRGKIAYGDFDFSSGNGQEREFERLTGDAGLEFYFVGRVSVKHNKIWAQIDAFSGRVGSAFSYTSPEGGIEKELVNIDIHGTIPRLIMGYSVWQKTSKSNIKIELIPYLGFRFVNFLLQSDVFDNTNVINIKPNWFEPLIGLYVPIIYKRFKIELLGDYGATGANYSWVISNDYRYRISKLIDVHVGWTHMHLYHNGIVNENNLKSSIRLFGPSAGIGFKF